MGTIHKLTQAGETIFPATVSDAVVHPQTAASITTMINEYNVSVLWPTSGTGNTNIYTLSGAITVLNTNLTSDEKILGVKVLFYDTATTVKCYYFKSNSASNFSDSSYWSEIVLESQPAGEYLRKDANDSTNYTITMGGAVVKDFVKKDVSNNTVPVTVFCGDWVDGSEILNPTPGNGIYLVNEFNDTRLQYETHEVRHKSGRWLCLVHQPVEDPTTHELTYNEPGWNSPYWQLVDGNQNYSIEFASSNGYFFRLGQVNTVITPHLFVGNVDITSDVAAINWNWSRRTDSGTSDADRAWTANHQGMKTLTLTNNDMPLGWSVNNRTIFTLTITVSDGSNTVYVDNQIIA